MPKRPPPQGPPNPQHKTLKDSTFKPKPKPDGPDPMKPKTFGTGDHDPDMTFGKKPGKHNNEPDLNNDNDDLDNSGKKKGHRVIHLVDSQNQRDQFKPKGYNHPKHEPMMGSDTALQEDHARQQAITDAIVKEKAKAEKAKALAAEKIARKEELANAWELQQQLYPKPEPQSTMDSIPDERFPKDW